MRAKGRTDHAVPRHLEGAPPARAVAHAGAPRGLPRPLGRRPHGGGVHDPPDHVRARLRDLCRDRLGAAAPRDPRRQPDVARRDLPDLRAGGERPREERTRAGRQAALPDPRAAGQAAAARPRLCRHRRDAGTHRRGARRDGPPPGRGRRGLRHPGRRRQQRPPPQPAGAAADHHLRQLRDPAARHHGRARAAPPARSATTSISGRAGSVSRGTAPPHPGPLPAGERGTRSPTPPSLLPSRSREGPGEGEPLRRRPPARRRSARGCRTRPAR